MIKARAILFLLSAFLVLPGASSWGVAAPAQTAERYGASEYSLAVVPFYSPEKIYALYTPLVTYLTKATHKQWELKLYHNHDSLIEAFCKSEVSLVLFGPVPLGRANIQCGAKPLLVAQGKDGRTTYRSIIVTADPAVLSMQDLRGRTFGFFKGSTAAHIIPARMLKDHGLNSMAVKAVFYESQDSIMNALIKHELAAAGIKEALFAKFKDAPLRILASSDDLPNFAFSAAPGVRAQVKKLFTAALVKLKPLGNTEDAALVKDWDDEIKNGMVPPSDAFLRDVMNVHGIYEEIMHEAR